MPADFVPAPDGEFHAWVVNFATYVNLHLADLGLVAADTAAMDAAATLWKNAYPAHVAAQTAAEAGRQAKDAARADLEEAVRPLVRRIQATPAVTDEQRAGMGITVPDREPSAMAAPTTRPIAMVDTSQLFRHIVGFRDEASPRSTAKPAGIVGAEIWMKVGDPAPTGPLQVVFVALDTRTPYTLDFNEVDAGKRVYYMLRWVSTRGDKGPWSETVVATIAA